MSQEGLYNENNGFWHTHNDFGSYSNKKSNTYFQTRTEAMSTMASNSTEQTTITAIEGMAGLLWYSASITCNNKNILHLFPAIKST
jgi:1-deoxy-D-xylulose 5-phosphate reductoisomerase